MRLLQTTCFLKLNFVNDKVFEYKLNLRTLVQVGHLASFNKSFDALRYSQVGKRHRVSSAELRHARSSPLRRRPPVFIMPILRGHRGGIEVGWLRRFVKECPDAFPGASSFRGKQKTMGISMTRVFSLVKPHKNLQTRDAHCATAWMVVDPAAFCHPSNFRCTGVQPHPLGCLLILGAMRETLDSSFS